MEFGVVLGPVFPTREEMSSKAAFDFEVEMLDRTAEAGFDGVSLNHHYLVGPEAQCFQPLPMAAHVMARHPHLYVMTTVFILPYHAPVEVAEAVATLDMMSPGKFLFGVGQGYRDQEAQALEIRNADRRDRMIESIAAMRALWQDGPATFHGKHFSFDEVDIGPRPVDPAGPPIIIAADKLKTVERIPRIGGDYWLPSARHSKTFLNEVLPAYKATLEEVGRSFDGLPITRDVCLADDEASARQVVQASYERMLHMQSGWGQPGERYDIPFEQLQEGRMVLGGPEQVAEGLIELNEEFGVEFAVLRVYTPGMEPAIALDMITRLGEEVLPLVRKHTGTGSLFAREEQRA